jgi:hypothetical protein
MMSNKEAAEEVCLPRWMIRFASGFFIVAVVGAFSTVVLTMLLLFIVSRQQGVISVQQEMITAQQQHTQKLIKELPTKIEEEKAR